MYILDIPTQLVSSTFSTIPIYQRILSFIIVVIVHVEKVMAIVLLCESDCAQQFKALMMILQDTEHDFYEAIPMPCLVSLRHPMYCLLRFLDNPYYYIHVFFLSLHRIFVFNMGSCYITTCNISSLCWFQFCL